MMEVWRRMKLVIKILSISVEEKILEEISEQWTVTDLHTVVTKFVLLTLSFQILLTCDTYLVLCILKNTETYRRVSSCGL